MFYFLLFLFKLDEEQQAAEFASVTESALEFRSFDLVIAGLIMQRLVTAGNITNNNLVCYDTSL